MFERKHKLRIKDLLQKQFGYIQAKEFGTLSKSRYFDHLVQYPIEEIPSSTNEHIMTRKTRTRRPRINSIQSGYCAVCHIPYNSVDDHIQSKRHQKLIGEDTNYISLNGFNLHHETNIDTFLNLNGIEGIGVNGTTIDRDFSPRLRSKNMPRTRAASVCDRVKPSPLSPTGSDITGHHLRSRRNINYMTPPLEEDSLSEKPDMEPVHEYRELRSSTRLLAKLTESDEVWNSGRPKRSCIRQKRASADERLVVDNKPFYKVEVMSTKLRSAGVPSKEQEPQKRLPSPKHEVDEKGLIVKFKKLRNSELVRLNNEATNFLFPKNCDSSEDEGDVDEDGANTTASSGVKNDSTLLLSSDNEESKSATKFKVEDEGSMDSTCSEGKRKKRRRTHAEAFIMDNQKYYKFETPGSRLRYHGSYLPPPPPGGKSSRNNGELLVKHEKAEETRPNKVDKDFKLSLDSYQFSFESVPKSEPWYNTFRRQDKGEMKYNSISDNSYWDPFILPYQLGPLPPLDPKMCITKFNQIMQLLREPPSASTSTGCTTPDPCASNSSLSMDAPDTNDDDSKMSATSTFSSTSTAEELKPVERKKRGRRTRGPLPAVSGKNPRKSPRQHASTLAILSSLIHQRKRRSGRPDLNSSRQSLPTIPEEVKAKSPPKQSKSNNLDYFLKVQELDDQLNACMDENLDELEILAENTIDFNSSKVTVSDILAMYDQEVMKETSKSARRFFNGTPGRKPGRRKKKNKTGWPNKNRRLLVKKEQTHNSSVKDDESTVDSMSVNMEESDEECEEETNSTDSISNKNSLNVNSSANNDQANLSDNVGNCDLNSDNRVDRNEQLNDKVLTNKVTNSGLNTQIKYQPYVCVQKLDGEKVVTKPRRTISPKRTSRRQRRMPGSPKSPRMLRKPRGRWYRER